MRTVRTIVECVAASVWALIVVLATTFVLAILFGQSLDGIKGWWAAIPLVGELAVMLTAGVWAFRSARKAFRGARERNEVVG